MEHQCKDCKHNHLNDGNEDMCSACSGYSDKFEPIEDKPMEVKCKKCKLGTGGRICGYKNSECSGSNYKYFESMEKKYRLKKDLPGVKVGTIFISSNGNFYCDVPRNIIINNNVFEHSPEWFEEVKENTLESIIDNHFISDEIKKNLEQCIVKQKIELLKFIHLSYSEYIYNKISELQKEIK